MKKFFQIEINSISEGEVFTCFYQNDSKQIVASSLKINPSNKKITAFESL